MKRLAHVLTRLVAIAAVWCGLAVPYQTAARPFGSRWIDQRDHVALVATRQSSSVHDATGLPPRRSVPVRPALAEAAVGSGVRMRSLPCIGRHESPPTDAARRLTYDATAPPADVRLS